jgi:hypothetical protein
MSRAMRCRLRGTARRCRCRDERTRRFPQPPPVLSLYRVLKTPDPHQKALLTDEIATLWRSGGIARAFDPDAPHEEPPARPARCVQIPRHIHTKDAGGEPLPMLACALSNGWRLHRVASLHPTDAWLLPANPAGTRA